MAASSSPTLLPFAFNSCLCCRSCLSSSTAAPALPRGVCTLGVFVLKERVIVASKDPAFLVSKRALANNGLGNDIDESSAVGVWGPWGPRKIDSCSHERSSSHLWRWPSWGWMDCWISRFGFLGQVLVPFQNWRTLYTIPLPLQRTLDKHGQIILDSDRTLTFVPTATTFVPTAAVSYTTRPLRTMDLRTS